MPSVRTFRQHHSLPFASYKAGLAVNVGSKVVVAPLRRATRLQGDAHARTPQEDGERDGERRTRDGASRRQTVSVKGVAHLIKREIAGPAFSLSLTPMHSLRHRLVSEVSSVRVP